MVSDSDKDSGGRTPPADDKKQRLAEALRRNLRRRKAAGSERAEAEKAEPEAPSVRSGAKTGR